jgi:ABC-type glycerol-3-phosphate transport system substrate-binding protein
MPFNLKKQTVALIVSLVLIILVVVFVLIKKSDYSEVEGKNLVPVENKVVLNWVGHWFNEGDREKLLREIANKYEFINQDVKINLKFPDELYNAQDSAEIRFIMEQIQKPVADWDILRIKEFYAPIAILLDDPNWGQKYLVDFGQVPGFFEKSQPFINSPMIKDRTGGIFICPYNEGQFWALYVNTEVAKKMGIEVKQYDMTFDDFLGYLKAAYEYNKSHDTYIAPIFEDFYWITTDAIGKELFYSLMDSYDECVGLDLTKKKIDALQKTYEALEELSKYKPIIKDRSKINWTRDNVYPLYDSCLFFVNGSWMYNIWKGRDKEKMRKLLPCELPVFKPSSVYLGGYAANWAIPKNAPHKEEAIKLMMFWTQPEVAEKWARYTKCPSGVKGNLTNVTFGIEPYESFMYTIEKKYRGNNFQQVDLKHILGVRNFQMPFRSIEILEGRMTAKEAMKEFKRKSVY